VKMAVMARRFQLCLNKKGAVSLDELWKGALLLAGIT
jgi:hypothetical protein